MDRICPNCQAENPWSRKFCQKCGEFLLEGIGKMKNSNPMLKGTESTDIRPVVVRRFRRRRKRRQSRWEKVVRRLRPDIIIILSLVASAFLFILFLLLRY